jgi:type II secretory pathway pseudopilin PulG
MGIPTGLLALVMVIIVAAYIARPFVSSRSGEEARSAGRRAAVLRQRAALLAERNQTYQALLDLAFEYNTNKLSEEEFETQRHRLVAQGVEILQKLDALPPLDETPDVDPIEAAVLAFRAGAEFDPPRQPGGNFCPQCGAKVAPEDRFCGACGARL